MIKKINLQKFTEMFFDRAFKGQKKSGAYFDEWIKRFLGGKHVNYMTSGVKRTYWKLIEELGEKSPFEKPMTREVDTNLDSLI